MELKIILHKIETHAAVFSHAESRFIFFKNERRRGLFGKREGKK